MGKKKRKGKEKEKTASSYVLLLCPTRAAPSTLRVLRFATAPGKLR